MTEKGIYLGHFRIDAKKPRTGYNVVLFVLSDGYSLEIAPSDIVCWAYIKDIIPARYENAV